jgi:hypothetical protein
MLYRTKIYPVATCAAVAVFALTSAASAQVRSERHIAGESIYDFEDDDLLAAGLGPMGSTIVIRPGAARQQLLRPRTQFVQEMLKSVEHI